MLEFLHSLDQSAQDRLSWQFLLSAVKTIESQHCRVFWQVDEHTLEISCEHSESTRDVLGYSNDDGWSYSDNLPPIFKAVFDLYLPVITKPANSAVFVVGHLGQSIDSQIATDTGDSFYVTGEENRKHLHCLRALCHAVVVGAGTVRADNPQLTTRAVPGANPVRVVIDPRAQLRDPLKLFSDGDAKTVLLHQSSCDLSALDMAFGPLIEDASGNRSHQVERWTVPGTDGDMPVASIVALLESRGLTRLFVEGGGITVGRFFEAGLLHRLHIAIAPLLVGAGTPSLQLPGSPTMLDAHRPNGSLYSMGDDVMWDFDLTKSVTDGPASATDANGALQRIY